MRFLLISILALAVAGVACRSDRPPQAGDRFRAQLDEDWHYWMTQYPETATYVGYPGQNDRWTDYSQAAIEARAAYLTRSLEHVAAIDRHDLPGGDQVTYDLYRDLLQTAVDGLAFHNDAMPIRGVIPHNLRMPMNQLEGIQQDIPRLLASMPAASRDDYEHLLARLGGIATLVDQTIALMEQGMEAGMTPPAITVRDLPAQVRAQIVTEPLTSPLLAAFTQWPDAVREADRQELTGRAADAYEQSVRPAFDRLHDFLVSRYLPACRETTDAASLPNGAALYGYNVRWHTTTGLTPDEIHETGLAEVARIREEMDRVMAGSGFTGSFETFVRMLREDPRFYFTEARALVTGYRDIAKRADPGLARLFGRLPQTPYGVQPMPEAVAPSQTTAYYEPGSLVGGRPGYMFANTYKLDARPRWEMEALTLHEAVPGHHLQISIAQELQGLPEFRKHSSYTAFVEGWALYAESLGEEMGFYADPYAKFGQLTYEMWRAVRLVVDTGLHARGWTRTQAIDYFRTHAPKTEQDIVVEIDRYIVWPGQALGYKIGQLRIRELRTASTTALGSRFDIRRFHDTVLGEGAVPLDVLDARVRAWTSAED